MFNRKFIKLVVLILAVFSLLLLAGEQAYAQDPQPPKKKLQKVSNADRLAAAERGQDKGFLPGAASKYVDGKKAPRAPILTPGALPDYFGAPNYANSPMPTGAISTSVTIANGGSGYSASAEVIIADVLGTGSGATATATIDAFGTITAINVTSQGTNYTAPTVVISDTTGIDFEGAATLTGPLTGGLRKFVDPLPNLYISGLSPTPPPAHYIPLGVPEPCTYSGQAADCYVIEVVQYREQMHSDLPPVVGTWPNQTGGTLMRGYRQTNTTDPYVSAPHYLGPTILASKDKPVRITFRNKLPTGSGGDLFLPVDTTVMGSGVGPDAMEGMEPQDCAMTPRPPTCYTQNRATLHLHGGLVPWISDGTTQQWTTPAGETASNYPKGVSVYNVPDMPNPGTSAPQGELTFYYNNEQSARLMFYHDHSWGITRLNVYAGEAAGYLLTDQVEKDMIFGTNVSGVNPGAFRLDGGTGAVPVTVAKLAEGLGIPLIIQDRTFVDPTTLPWQDPTWPFVNPQKGDLWYPHTYMPNQNPSDLSGMNTFGRWHYGPWFYPPTNNIPNLPVPNPKCLPTPPPPGTYLQFIANQGSVPYDCSQAPWENPYNPGGPNISMAAEAFMDTPIVNGTAYPYLTVDPKTYRFRILNAADDRFWNLQMYVADPAVNTAWAGQTEVKLVDASAAWPGRNGYSTGYMVPDRNAALKGPSFIQIGTEGGFLPKPAKLTTRPIGWNGDAKAFDVGVVDQGTLILGPAERADVLVDFSAFAGKTIILYNDSPAPFPALDERYDYYTGNLDWTSIGGAPPTQAGYGPNTRTIMQIRVSGGAPAATFNEAALNAVFADGADPKRGVFEVSQEPIIVPNANYNSAYGRTTATSFPTDQITAVRIQETGKTFKTISGITMTVQFQPKAIHDEMSGVFDEYGRMSGMLGLVAASAPNGFVPYPFAGPPVDLVKLSMTPMTEPAPGDGTQIWKISHNGVDTHPIHFHLFNVQLINRVAWDNAVRLPDANELGWKETVRVNPLQDTIVALRPVAPLHQPFKVPNMERVLDPSMPQDIQLMGPQIPGQGAQFMDPVGNPVTVLNRNINFGWEYTYHCHILGHEEMDMMHSVSAVMPPSAPAELTATNSNAGVALSWTDDSMDETSFRVERGTASTGPWTTLTTFMSTARSGVGATLMYTDTTVAANTTYFYRVFAVNVVGTTLASSFTQPVAALFPTMQADSTPATVSVSTTGLGAPSNLQATQTDVAGNAVTVNLTWQDNATNETSFRVQRATDAGFAANLQTFNINTPNTTSYADTTALNDATYYYRVGAVNATNVAWSNALTVMTTPAAPGRRGFGDVRPTLIIVRWRDYSTTETGFRIQRANNAAFTTNPVTFTVAANQVSYNDTTVQPSTVYYYRVFAFNASGNSLPSQTIWAQTPQGQQPPPPQGLVAQQPAAGPALPGARSSSSGIEVELSWEDIANDEQGFIIQRADGQTPSLPGDTRNPGFVNIGTAPANALSYMDTTAQPGMTYTYQVLSYNTFGNSAPTSENITSIALPRAGPEMGYYYFPHIAK